MTKLDSVRLSPASWTIMVFLWENGPSTLLAIHRHLALSDFRTTQLSFIQAKALLDRLTIEGYLQANTVDDTYIAAIPRAAIDRWYYRWVRVLLWKISYWTKLRPSTEAQDAFGIHEHLPNKPGVALDQGDFRLPLFKISLAHPKILSKRFTSSFFVQIYLSDMRHKVAENVRSEFANQDPVEHIYDSQLSIGRTVKVKLFCPEIIFSDPATKKLDSDTNAISFLGKPKDDCHPGVHQATIVISDEKTGHEFHSVNFPVRIVDFVFDHISRLFLSNCATAILSIGSFSMFVLALLGQIDTTLGLATGTTAGALASAIHIRFLSLYQSPKINISSQP